MTVADVVAGVAVAVVIAENDDEAVEKENILVRLGNSQSQLAFELNPWTYCPQENDDGSRQRYQAPTGRPHGSRYSRPSQSRKLQKGLHALVISRK